MCTFVYGQIILWGSTFSGILWQRERVGCLSLRFLYEIQKKVKKKSGSELGTDSLPFASFGSAGVILGIIA